MEGFSLECSKLPCWAFDPVSTTDVLVMPRAKSKSIIATTLLESSSSVDSSISGTFYSTSSSNSGSGSLSLQYTNGLSTFDSGQQQLGHCEKVYHLPTLTLSSLAPGTTFIFDTSQLVQDGMMSDSNNNTSGGGVRVGELSLIQQCLTSSTNISSSSSSSTMMTSSSSQSHNQSSILSSTYLTLDPLVGSSVRGLKGLTQDDHPSGPDLNVDNNSSALVGEASGGLRLPKFEEIHFDRAGSRNKDNQNDPQLTLEDTGSNGVGQFGHFTVNEDDVGVDVDDGGLGSFGDFNIHDLTSTYSHSGDGDDDDTFPRDLKIEDLDEESPCSSRATTLRLSSTTSEEDLEIEVHSSCNNNTMLDAYLDEDDGVTTTIGAAEEDEIILAEEVDLEADGDELEDDEEEEEKDENSLLNGGHHGGGLGLGLGLDLDLEVGPGGKAELKCKFCGFVCCSKSSLGIHERRHTGEKPYSCKYCGRLFNSAQCCKHHERLHTGDKPFECKYCKKKYAVSTRLKRHERVHTREEPYKCMEDGCGKTFRWFDAFRDHRNTHTGVALYLCSVCGKSFTSYLKFYYHERGHFLKRERDKDKDRKLKGNIKDGPNVEGKVKTIKTKAPRKPRAKKNQNQLIDPSSIKLELAD